MLSCHNMISIYVIFVLRQMYVPTYVVGRVSGSSRSPHVALQIWVLAPAATHNLKIYRSLHKTHSCILVSPFLIVWRISVLK
jgi:hypothetical protein